MIGLNGEIDALDNKLTGKMQLSLYAAVQDLLLDRLVWFLRNVDLKQGLETIVAHHRDGIAQVEAALDGALSKQAAAVRDRRVGDLTRGDVPDALARRIANLPLLKAAPDIILVADRAKKSIAEVTATYFATGLSSARPRRRGGAGHRACRITSTARARPRCGSDRRCRAPADIGDGRQGRTPAPMRWKPGSKPRRAEVERIRARDPRNRRVGADVVDSCRWRRACWAIWRGRSCFRV